MDWGFKGRTTAAVRTFGRPLVFDVLSAKADTDCNRDYGVLLSTWLEAEHKAVLLPYTLAKFAREHARARIHTRTHIHTLTRTAHTHSATSAGVRAERERERERENYE